ncbi:GIY-YIG nuclease family protein [Candidatus Microgenomates bacterium]|nr:MAG: GIY-YIG nuclease family protein [Candidatus Microgenomates bacterium]
MEKVWYVYIITNYSNSVFYTGVTNNLLRRIWEHKQGFIKNSFSSKYRLYKLIWFEEFPTPYEAIQAEKKVKDYRREKKLNLIKSKNPNLQDLYTLC